MTTQFPTPLKLLLTKTPELITIPIPNYSHPLLHASLTKITKNLNTLLTTEEDPRTIQLANSSIQELDQLESFVFEKLNTGHWRDVDGVWRGAWSLICLLKLPLVIIKSPQQQHTQTLIKTCDNGLLFGSPIHSNILATIADELCCSNIKNNPKTVTTQPEEKKKLDNSELHHQLKNRTINEFKIDTLNRPSLQKFAYLMATSTPAKLIGIVDHWPALSLWGVEYIREVAGPRSVPVEIGQRYTSQNWTQKIMTINEFIDSFIYKNQDNENEIGYIAQHNLFEQIQTLSKHISTPDYTTLSKTTTPKTNAWFGPAHTISPTHTDPHDNILVQVFGTKLIRLFPPGEGDKLEPYGEGSLLSNTSSLDVEGEGLMTDHVLMNGAVHCDLEINAGEAVFIPTGWWHYVKSVCFERDDNAGASFSVSYWF